MKFRSPCAAVVLIGTSLLPVAGTRSIQAAEIKIVSPSSYKDREGEGQATNCCPPFRFQQVFPAADFAALGNQPHWIVSYTWRPDQSVRSPLTAQLPDQEVRLSTTERVPHNLSLQFDDNFGSDVTQFYRGRVIPVADAHSGLGPREFYHTEFPAGVTPFLYNPSQGNLLFDVISWQGETPARADLIPGIQTALYAEPPLATLGDRNAAAIFEFTFVPVTPGDYNRDGTVDGADYVVWRNGLGTTYTQADYDAWRANFEQTIGSGGALPSAEPLSIAVPEPAAVTMLIMAMVVYYARRRSSLW
jgi:hypothetical protein